MKNRQGNTHRPERVASVIQRNVAVIIDTAVSDPRVSGVSVVDVKVSRDLKYATVYVYVHSDKEETITALNNCASYIRHQLADMIKEMRVIPKLSFELDDSQSYYERIDSIIRDLNDGEKRND